MKVSTNRGIFPIIFITVVVLIAVVLLAWTDGCTRDRIAAQEEAKLNRMLTEMFPDMSEYTIEDDIYTIYSDGAGIGYAFLAVGKGYGGKINILVGLEDETTIKGVTVVTQLETPGLGSRITGSSFSDQFAGLNIGAVALTRDGGEIDAITGSTISSRAVVEAVKLEGMEKVKLLKDRR
ncbi:RnfABCDGE type electron transport complex subunit G [Chloroflexota bacterium]